MNIWCKYTEEYLASLCSEFGLERLVKGCGCDRERIYAVCKWVSQLWEHDGASLPSKRRPDVILREVISEGKRFRCVEYSIAAAGCRNALGVPARALTLYTEDCESRAEGAAHSVLEAYDRDRGCWIMADVQFGAVPLANGRTVSAYRLRQALHGSSEADLTVDWFNNRYTMDDNAYFDWIYAYLYNFSAVCFGGKAARVMLVPDKGREVSVVQNRVHFTVDRYIYDAEEFYSFDRNEVMRGG